MKYLIFLVVYFALCVPNNAQNHNIRFKHLGVQDGLSRSWVRCFLQDHTGMLWIGTADGLNKFDGEDLHVYKYLPGKRRGLDHNTINLIFEDSRHQLWIGTQAGLNLYQRDVDDFVSFSYVNYVTSIYELRPNELLLGAAGGLFLFNTVNHKVIQLHGGIYVEKIVRDSRSNIWLATHTGLRLFNAGDNTVRRVELGVDENHPLRSSIIKAIFEDSRGGLWLGTGFHGLFHYRYPDGHAGNGTLISFESDPSKQDQLTPGAIYSIAEDEDHDLWVGVENGGINVLNLDAFEKGSHAFTRVLSDPSDFSSLSNNSIHALYRDRQNTMWVGTYAGGADRYNKLLQRFDHHKAIAGSSATINDKYVNAILDTDDRLWIGTEKGLNCYDKSARKWKYFTHDFKNQNSIGSDAVLTIMQDSDGKIWVGTWTGGVSVLDEASGSFRKFDVRAGNPETPHKGNVRKIIEGKDHRIWIGKIGDGIEVYDQKKHTLSQWRETPKQNSLSSDWVVDMAEDYLGNIWISTTEAVDMLNPATGHFTSFTHDSSSVGSINYNGATCLFEDSRHTMWVGTSNGLNYFVRGDSSFRHYTVADGLPNNFIKAITEDKDGNIWLSTNNTLTVLKNGTSLPARGEFRSFPVFDGQVSSEFACRAAYTNRDGRLYFGSTNGYFSFDPSGIKNNDVAPEIAFTSLRINNIPVEVNDPDSPLQQDIAVTRQIQLSRKQNVFTIGFAALNFLEPENNQYAYKLEGFDKKWNQVGHQQSATYTNLDPGHYTFRVRASNNDGVWNEQGISIGIEIMPAWWQTTLAKVLCVLLAIVGIFFFRKHTIISVNLKNVLWREHLEKEKWSELARMKQQFFANVSHEIRTPLTLILGPLNKLAHEEKTIPELRMILRNSTRLKVLVDQFLDFSKMESQMMIVTPTRTEVVGLTRSIIANFTDYADQRNVQLTMESGIAKCVAPLDQDKYHKILTNLLSNAVKSISGTGSVVTQLDFDPSSSELILRVTDTGRGIAPQVVQHIFERYYSGAGPQDNAQGTGIGLSLVRDLVDLQKGKISVHSTIGKGTTFTVALPLQAEAWERGHTSIVLFNERPVNAEDNHPDTSPGKSSFEHTILVIDDNRDMCDYVESILCDEFNVIKENDCLNIPEKIGRYMPDLIISDVMMPGLDGLQLCKFIKDDVRFSHIPVILLTAKATRNDHVAGYETGADDYLYKPFDEHILKARVKNLIARLANLRQHLIGHDGIIHRHAHANNLDVKFMEDVVEQIKQHYTNSDFNVNQVIEKMGMSRSLFYKKFKTLSDQSIHDLIKTLRLTKAATLLAEGGMSVSEVAYECGFTDPAYFSRVFKEYYDVTPKDFSTHRKTA